MEATRSSPLPQPDLAWGHVRLFSFLEVVCVWGRVLLCCVCLWMLPCVCVCAGVGGVDYVCVCGVGDVDFVCVCVCANDIVDVRMQFL